MVENLVAEFSLVAEPHDSVARALAADPVPESDHLGVFELLLDPPVENLVRLDHLLDTSTLLLVLHLPLSLF